MVLIFGQDCRFGQVFLFGIDCLFGLDLFTQLLFLVLILVFGAHYILGPDFNPDYEPTFRF